MRLRLGITILLMLLTSAANATPSCFYNDQMDFRYPLPKVTKWLREGGELKIVALGSSSTAGAGASSPQNSYPSQLETILQQYLPRHRITVLNRGVNGDMTRDMLTRLQKDVFEYF